MMDQMGYGFGGQIGSGYCWGRYMIIYMYSWYSRDFSEHANIVKTIVTDFVSSEKHIP